VTARGEAFSNSTGGEKHQVAPPTTAASTTAAAPLTAAALAAAGDPEGFDPQLCGVDVPVASLTFEQLLSALERVIGRLSSGDLGIEAAADLYEQAEILHALAEERLRAVEARIGSLGLPGQA